MSRPSADTGAAVASSGSPQAQVRKRHVFYISGFDPKGPAHYHRLYADQAELAGAVGGYRCEVGKRRKLSEQAAGWTVTFAPLPVDAAETAASTTTEVEFLRWDDIVREHWPRNPAVLALDLVLTTWLYVRSGALWRMFRLSWPPVVALVVPFLILAGLLLALPLAGFAGWAIGRASGWWPLGVLAALALFAAAFAGARLAEQRLNMQWLLRSYAFTGRQGTRGWPLLESRLDAFARAIADRVARAAGVAPDSSVDSDVSDGCDEVLVVAHSSGSIMAVSALARALVIDPRLTQRGPRVALLTLGQWIPLLSSLPHAVRFRAELQRLADDAALDWVDFTAPADGCCFALTDPIAAAGAKPTRANHPRLLSPRFAAMFSPARYAAIRRDRFHLHFQYLMASELPGDYDYFAITAGPQFLRQRFQGQASITDFTQFRPFGSLESARPGSTARQ